MSHKSVPQSVPQECPTRVSYKSVLQECPTRVSRKSVPQECPKRVSHESVPQECPTRVSDKSVPQECPTRLSHNSVPLECFTRVSYKSDPQECPSQKSVPQECHLDVLVFRTCLHSGSWVPSCFFVSLCVNLSRVGSAAAASFDPATSIMNDALQRAQIGQTAASLPSPTPVRIGCNCVWLRSSQHSISLCCSGQEWPF